MLSFREPTFDVSLIPCCACCPRLGRGNSFGRSGSIMKLVRLAHQDILLAWDYFIFHKIFQKWDILITINTDHCLFPPQSPPSHPSSDGHGHFWNLAKGGGFELGFAEGIIRGPGSSRCHFIISESQECLPGIFLMHCMLSVPVLWYEHTESEVMTVPHLAVWGDWRRNKVWTVWSQY